MMGGAKAEALVAFAQARIDEALATGSEPIPAFRQALREGRQRLFGAFDQGVPAADLVRTHSLLVDTILTRAWERHLPPASPGATAIALIAVGGYGRGELHPGSDLDILILLGEDEGEGRAALDAPLEAFITFLWDIGTEVGQSVRTLGECVEEARADVTVMTNLMEGRLITGDAQLLAAMRTATGPDRLWPSAAFFAAKTAEQRQRWHKYGGTAYNLEPNIKENPGGLRDIQMIGWVAKRHFAADTLHDLVVHGFLTEGEYLTLIEGQARLWRIRFQLHRLAGRREDRLLFDYQRSLARDFGFVDDGNHNLAVEQFMQQYYRTVIELNRLNEMLLQLFQEAILLRDQLGPPVAINRRFQAVGGFLEVTHPDVFRHNPVALLEIFHLLQTHPEIRGVRASTIRLIRERRHLIDDRIRADLRARSFFMEIMRHPKGPAEALSRMNRYGVLAAYLPAFANIVGRMQYDLFHVYTVDEHTLRLLQHLCDFADPEGDEESPFRANIAQEIPKLELLYLAGLFHDIGKGRGGDHSILGARDAWDFCQLHELPEFDSRLVSWLVEKHLVMSMTAQRKDLSDTRVIQEFATLVSDVDRLNYLYLLTVADMRATDPGRWNAWKDSLLKELYQATRLALQRGLENPLAQDDLIQQKQDQALHHLGAYGLSRTQCTLLWIKFSLDYFQHNAPDEIAWQTRLVLTNPPGNLPLVAIRPVTTRGCSEVFMYTPDRNLLFSRATAVLDQQGLNIVDARIMTTDDAMALNSFHVLDYQGQPLTDPLAMRRLADALRKVLAHPEDEIQGVRRLPRKLKNFPTVTEVSFLPDPRNHRTLMRLATLDRPGLLAEIGAIFEEGGIRLHNAKIATIGALVDDVFFITTRNETPITAETSLRWLRAEIHRRLEQAGD
ncbi:MAG: [protein-PII] uridylyltransferase [Chromatiaceae bacterium]|nr:[protein-PII] uridylyltransferase [Chromatiaceae bacterium]